MMNCLEDLIRLNSHLKIKTVTDSAFVPYGHPIANYDFSDLTRFLEHSSEIPEQGNIYKGSVPEMEKFDIKNRLEIEFYGEMPIQIGYCNGRNSTLNGLEYHIGSEINVAATDLVLMLGKLQDVRDRKYRAADVEVFFLEKGTAVRLYETTLHFAPCKTSPEGFRCVVILPKGTNEPLQGDRPRPGDELLFARNKWLLAHPDRKALIERGASPGIIGENTELKIAQE